MQTALIIAQITIAVLLAIAILIQNKGAGVSAIFGGGGSGAYRTKRGFEKWLHVSTIILVILFVTVGVINLFIT